MALGLGAFHLWYLYAYMNTLFTFLLIKRCRIKAIAYSVATLLICANIILGKYSFFFSDSFITAQHFLRNFLFIGIPCFLAGILVKKHLKVLSKRELYMYIISFVLLILTFIEYKYTNNTEKIIGIGALYISTVPTAIILVFVTLSIKQTKDNILSKIGREYSLYIYIFHVMTMIILSRVKNIFISGTSYEDYYNWWHAVIVFIITIIISIIFKTCILPVYHIVKKRIY